MPKLTLQTATVRIADFPGAGRLLTVRATCFGSPEACATARLAPRRHASVPEDGLWDIDLVCEDPAAGEGALCWRDVVFTGEADWCEGVRLHGPGGVLEHRMDLFPRNRTIPTHLLGHPLEDIPVLPTRRRMATDVKRLVLDGLAAASVLAAFGLLPLALPASASEPARPAAVLATDRLAPAHEAHPGCRHRQLLPGPSLIRS